LPGFAVRQQWHFKRAVIDVRIRSRKKSIAAASGVSVSPAARAHLVVAASEQAPAKKRGHE
jgi:hypothetical protein